MYGSRGSMWGVGGDGYGYEVGSKRQRMIDSNPYFAVSGSGSGYRSYNNTGFRAFPVVRLRGLPFDCNDVDIAEFFTGLDIVDILLIRKSGRFSGEAMVLFATPMHAELALQRDHHNIGHRYVEVFMCKKQDYYQAVAAEVNHGVHRSENRSSPSTRAKRSHDKDKERDIENLEFTEFLKLRGLPYSVTKEDIIEFFDEFKLSPEKILITYRSDGKATGDAYVEFDSADEAKNAMSKDKMTMGSRYIELFPSTPDEARLVGYRSTQ